MSTSFDFRPFESWAVERFGELPPQHDLYDVADRACVLYTLSQPLDAARWAPAFARFRTEDGCYIETAPSHVPWHSTAFAIAAMELCDLTVNEIPAFDEYREVGRAVAFLDGLDWKQSVYGDSHRGAALCSIAALVPGFADDAWFDAVFDALDRRFDPDNGMQGKAKPRQGDLDQIGGTFHYHFVYEHFDRSMPYPEPRVDAVLGLQQPDGIWHSMNPLWLTLDAVYLMTRTVRQHPYRIDDVEQAVRAVLTHYRDEICAPDNRDQYFAGHLAAHGATAVLSLLAEAQALLGNDTVCTERPLRLVLDRRPFI